MKAGDGVPPVVDHRVEGIERLDLVPPHRRVEQHVARLQLRDLRRRERLAEPREAFEIGRVEVDHGHDLPARRRLERPRIEVLDLLRRKQREAPPADQCSRRCCATCRGARSAVVRLPIQAPTMRRTRREHRVIQDEIVLGAEARAGTGPRRSNRCRWKARRHRQGARSRARGNRRAGRVRTGNPVGWRRACS